MWIALVACIEILRFWLVLSALRQQSLFVGWTGFVAYAVLDWLFFYVVLAVADAYFPLFPNTNWRKNTRLGNFLRRRVNMTFRNLDQEPVPKPAVFACHSHGVMATGQLLAFMMYPEDCPELGNAAASTTSVISSQMWMFPLTSVVCRLLGARPVSEFEALVKSGTPVVSSVGGTKEMSLTAQDTAEMIHIRKHTGFLRICYNYDRPVVPLVVLGNHTLYDILKHPLLESLQRFHSRLLGYGMPIVALGAYGTILPKSGASVQILRLPAFRKLGDETVADYTERYYKSLVDYAMRDATTVVLVEE